ncbi:MAG: hypothetical protein QY326_05210 [Bdellovibrionota bacterium]|nr:MAG: hypothetical protein QY326_05210 [Bdellovibrionota bacterium]
MQKVVSSRTRLSTRTQTPTFYRYSLKSVLLGGLLAISTASPSLEAQQARYSVRDLPDGFYAYHLNDTGYLAGSMRQSSGESRAAFIGPDGTLRMIEPDVESSIYDVSLSGNAAVGVTYEDGAPRFNIKLWTRQPDGSFSRRDLAPLIPPAPDNDHFHAAYEFKFISGDSVVAGKLDYGPHLNVVIDAATNQVHFPAVSPPEYQNDRPGAVITASNSNGLVAGFDGDSPHPGLRTFLWSIAQGRRLVPTPLGRSYFRMIGLTNPGKLIGVSSSRDDYTGGPLLVKWDVSDAASPARIEAITRLQGLVYLQDVNSELIMVGQRRHSNNYSSFDAVLVEANGQERSLETLLDASGAGLDLRDASEINELGQILALDATSGMKLLLPLSNALQGEDKPATTPEVKKPSVKEGAGKPTKKAKKKRSKNAKKTKRTTR